MEENYRKFDVSSINLKMMNIKEELRSLRKSAKSLSSIKRKVVNKLKRCVDPELGSDIVNLGFIYGIELKKAEDKYDVKIIMTLTSPFCPLSDYILSQVKERILGIKGVANVDVEFTFDPPWNPSMLSSKLQQKLFKQYTQV
ncbi:MAG: metal-sulfur cluster assembly factor [Candidatus Micrarchaeota archaeon]|nr:metal-sulfur cluster assembly factor [Candidatus Micrarchaeota archaeon]